MKYCKKLFFTLLCLTILFSATFSLIALSPADVRAAETGLSDQEWDVLLLTNRERINNGVAPVTTTNFLQDGCDIRAKELNVKFDHKRPNGSSCFTVLNDVQAPGYAAAGENIAAGYPSATAVVNGWMNSPGHRQNILNPYFAHMGAGLAVFSNNSYGKYWVQLFYTGFDCNYTAMNLSAPERITVPFGTKIEDLRLTAELTCDCGKTYLPVMAELCSGYQPNTFGTQKVTVSAFGLSDTIEIKVSPEAFTDVPINAWFYEAVNYATENSLMNGIGGNKFSPDANMTRAMLVTVLWRYEGKPKEGANGFTDVKNGVWYTDAVAWAAKNNIVYGTSPTTFDPEGNITREQIAAILYRYANQKGLDTGKRASLNAFPDADRVGSYAKEAMEWCVAEGIINGSDGKLAPLNNATRAQVATMLMRYIENIKK